MRFNIKSLNYSTILIICLIVLLTILGELSDSFKTLLTSVTGHHWVTKSVLSLIFFVVIYFLISKTVKDWADSNHLIIDAIVVTLLGGAIIFGFYAWHFMH